MCSARSHSAGSLFSFFFFSLPPGALRRAAIFFEEFFDVAPFNDEKRVHAAVQRAREARLKLDRPWRRRSYLTVQPQGSRKGDILELV